jgi:hypothetical protein
MDPLWLVLAFGGTGSVAALIMLFRKRQIVWARTRLCERTRELGG